MSNSELEEKEIGNKIAVRIINNFRYVDNIILLVGSEESLAEGERRECKNQCAILSTKNIQRLCQQIISIQYKYEEKKLKAEFIPLDSVIHRDSDYISICNERL